jgi:hypothetical protein
MWVFNVWKSREDFDRFEQERLMPAVREVFDEDPGEPPQESSTTYQSSAWASWRSSCGSL